MTDSGDSTTDCGAAAYSNAPSFNVDSTKLAVICQVGFSRFKVYDFNSTLMQRSNGRIQANGPAGAQEYGAQWSRVSANKFSVVGNTSLYEVTIPAGGSTTWTNTLIRDFASVIGVVGTTYITQHSQSTNDDVYAFHYVKNGAVTGYIAYKRSTDTVLLHQVVANINEVEIDKSGRYLVALTGSTIVWDLQPATPTSTVVTNQPFNHRAMGNGIVVDAGTGGGSLYRRNLATPNSPTVIVTPWNYGNQQDHFSMTTITDTYMFGSRYHINGGAVSAPFDNENVLVKTDGTGVRRVSHHWSRVYGNDYDAQPKANLSPDGQFIAWNSNWRGADGNTRNDVYIARISGVAQDSTAPAAPVNLRVR